MSLLELLRLAFSRLRTSRLRAALTMLGVIIGVASVVALVGVGQGTTSNITNRLNSLGTNLLTVSPTGGAVHAHPRRQPTPSPSCDTVAAVAPEVVDEPDRRSRRQEHDHDGHRHLVVVPARARLRGLAGLVPDRRQRGPEPACRRPRRDHRRRPRPDASDLGTTISIGGIPFTVIGILQPKGGSGFQDPDDQIMVPVGAVQKYFVGGDSVRTIGVSVADPAQMDATTTEITALLRERHDLAAADDDDFNVFDQTQLLEAASSITGTLTLLLGGIASISLIVGGIGIMNIMLVSVRERTREIGIRKAIGARGRDILAQFLVEALTLSLLGGLIGIVVGLVVSAVIGQLAGWGFTFSPTTVAVAVLFSLAVGVVFGVWPARQAARLDPISALRYE